MNVIYSAAVRTGAEVTVFDVKREIEGQDLQLSIARSFRCERSYFNNSDFHALPNELLSAKILLFYAQ